MPSGGRRVGAGRPTNLERQLKLAIELVRVLQDLKRQGIRELGEAFPRLVHEEILTALDPELPVLDRQRSRQFLIKLFNDIVPLEQVQDNPFQRLVLQWKGDIKVQAAPIIETRAVEAEVEDGLAG